MVKTEPIVLLKQPKLSPLESFELKQWLEIDQTISSDTI